MTSQIAYLSTTDFMCKQSYRANQLATMLHAYIVDLSPWQPQLMVRSCQPILQDPTKLQTNIPHHKIHSHNGPRSRLPLNNRLPQSGESHDPGSQKARSERRSLHRALQPQARPDGGAGVAEAQRHHVQSCRHVPIPRVASRESSLEAKCISTCCASRHIAFSAIEPS